MKGKIKNIGTKDKPELVVEYTEYLDYEEISEKWYNPVIKQFPLKQSQWQSVVDNKLLHTDVEFAKVGRGGEREAEIIIPTQKKRMYSEEEVKEIVSRAIDAGKMHEYGQFIQSNDQWFEQNVK